MLQLKETPVVKAEMLVRRAVDVVYEAFVDPAVTTKFWFTKSSGRLEQGRHIRWDWEMYGVGDELTVEALDPNRFIRIGWSDGTKTEWTFTPRGEEETLVAIVNRGFDGDGDDIVAQAIDSMGGYMIVLCGCKALLEHGIVLNAVRDKAPDAWVSRKD